MRGYCLQTYKGQEVKLAWVSLVFGASGCTNKEGGGKGDSLSIVWCRRLHNGGRSIASLF